MFEYCRILHNAALQERISFYRKYKKSLSYNIQSSYLKEINKQDNLKTYIHSQTVQAVLGNLDTSFDNYFRRILNGEKPGFPRFKKFLKLRSIFFPQCNLKQGGVKLLENGKLKITGIEGEIKLKLHRKIEGNIKNVRIKRTPTGKYYLIVVCDNISFPEQAKTGKVVGIDLGLTSYVTAYDGDASQEISEANFAKFHHPKPYKTSLEKLRYQSNKLSKSTKGSNSSKKKKLKLAKLHEKIANQREDFQHKFANKLVKENDVLILEDLNISEMLQKEENKGLHRSITDASWGKFIEKLEYKAERAGKQVIKVSPKNTSKGCSNCGFIKKNLTLYDRIFNCNSCEVTIDRDLNAAVNVKRLGISQREENSLEAF